jgi:hypothetical protein
MAHEFEELVLDGAQLSYMGNGRQDKLGLESEV